MILHNRTDTKWAHPEYLEENIYSLAGSASMFKNQYTPEEYEELKKPFGEPILAAANAIMDPEFAAYGSWHDTYAEKGCPEEPETGCKVSYWMPNHVREKEKLPVMFYPVGGGLISGGTIELSKYGLASIMHDTGMKKAVYVIFEYRTANGLKENCYPAAINDCHCAYQWMIENAEQLHINTDKIIIVGASTGGHFALSAAFRLQKYDWCGAPMPRGIISQEPPMDDISFSNSMLLDMNSSTGTDMIDGEAVRDIFKVWLGDRYGDPELGPEAVPSRVTVEDLKKGFPPVWFTCEPEFDPGRDGVYDFVAKLHQAGIFCDLHVWGGGTHQANVASASRVARRMKAVYVGAIRDALKFDLRRQWISESDL